MAASVLLVACGRGDDDGGDDDAPGTPDGGFTTPDAEPMPDAAPPFALTSTAITDGGMFPDQYTCEGANISPPLAWTAAPNAQSYAIVFHDTDNGVIHWVIWDIPSTTLSLPEDVANDPEPAVPAGAKQARSYDDATYGYLGPCPGSETHLYQFTVYALDVATMPDITTSTDAADAKTEIENHSINGTSLRANSD